MPKVIKLLFVTHNFPPMKGGIPVISWEICNGLYNLGIDVRVLTSADPMDNPPDSFQVVCFKENKKLGKLRRISVLPAMRRVIREFKPDVVLLASIHPYAFFCERLCALHKIPYAVITHGLEVLRIVRKQNLVPLEAWGAKRALEHAKTVFAVSQFTAQLDRKLVGRELSVQVIPNGVNSTAFTPGDGIRTDLIRKAGIQYNNPFLLLSVSILGPRKGHTQVLKALEILKDKYPQLFYLIAGDGSERSNLEKEVKERKLKERVIFLGMLSLQDLIETYRSVDLFILTSRTLQGKDVEGFGVVYLEANACGLPVIAGNTGGVPDAVRDGETGILIDSENPTEIASAIERLINDEYLRRTMGRNGRKWAEQHDWSRLIPVYKKALEAMIQ